MNLLKESGSYFLVGLIAVILGFLSKAFYRPFIYSHNISDFKLADSLPSFFYVVGFSSLLSVNPLGIKPKTIIIIVTLASIVFEGYQFSHKGFFDVPDTLYSIFGGTVSILIYRYFLKNRKSL